MGRAVCINCSKAENFQAAGESRLCFSEQVYEEVKCTMF